MTYGDLRRLSARVANGLDELGLDRGEKIALFLPMTPEAVAAYLGIVLSGRCVVGIADAAAPPEFRKRARIADARAVITVDTYLRDGKQHAIYSKVVDGNGPRAIVIPRAGPRTPFLRDGDTAWTDFLSDRDAYEAVSCRPGDHTNILFSSGTTKDPKAIPWTHTTPIKSAADAYLHQDTRSSDVLAWPTSFGWMMGPWLTYASLVNRATMALYVGATTTRGEVFLVPPSIGLSTELVNYDNDEEYYDGVPKGVHGERLRRHGDQIERLGNASYRHLGRIDDMININGVKTSSEEIRSVLANDSVYDSKPIAVDLDGSGQHRLVIYAVPRDKRLLGSEELRDRLRD